MPKRDANLLFCHIVTRYFKKDFAGEIMNYVYVGLYNYNWSIYSMLKTYSQFIYLFLIKHSLHTSKCINILIAQLIFIYIEAR